MPIEILDFMSKAIIDKADMAAIVSRISPEELRTLDVFIKQTGIYPNIVTDIYKLRRGRFTNVRIWSYMDLGTLRKTDLFLTDGSYNEVSDFTPFKAVFEFDDMAATEDLLNLLNDGVVDEVKEKELFPVEEKIPQTILPEKDDSLFGGLI